MNTEEQIDKWIPIINKFLILSFLGVFILQFGMWHGRKLERQEISHTNEMWNEMVACFKIKAMYEEQLREHKK